MLVPFIDRCIQILFFFDRRHLIDHVIDSIYAVACIFFIDLEVFENVIIQGGLFNRILMLYLKSQDSGIIQSILDRVSMQFLPILIVRCSGQLPFGLLFILFKNRCPSKAEPSGIWEELLYFIHIFRTQSTVTFIHDKDDMLAQQLFETFYISFLLLLLGMAQCGL